MSSTTAALAISPAARKAVERLYDSGQYVQALRQAESVAPLHEWQTTSDRIMAARIAANVGGARLADAWMLRTWRADPDHPAAIYYYARTLLHRRGVVKAWEFLRPHEVPEDVGATEQADWYALRGLILGRFRDFERAHAALDQAEAIEPADPWICTERATVLEMEDRYDDALAAARRALEIRPWFRPAVQTVAHHLGLHGADEEAKQLLREALERIESASVALQLAQLQLEEGDYVAARESLDRAVEYAPLADRDFANALTAQRCDAAYYCGDLEQATELAREVTNTEFYEKLAERMSASPANFTRTVLPVEFVRQHHVTCAPATLTTLTRYWNCEVDHLDLARTICYDGTPNESERRWAEDSGFVVREFTVSEASAHALIDRGIPFTLSTVEPGNAHLQAVIGYDTTRNTLIIRDPYYRRFVEFAVDELLQQYQASGPRGFAFVPQSQAHRLQGLDLPDAELYDHFHRLHCALRERRRDDAVAEQKAMQERDEDHRLTSQALLSIGSYDENPVLILQAVERLLQQFPNEPLFSLTKLSCLRQIGRRAERCEVYEQLSREPDCNPIVWQQFAQELAEDAREHERALGLLDKALTAGIDLGGSLFIRANLLWRRREFETALEFYRLAVCVEDKNESFAQSYFSACRTRGQEQDAVQFLRQRFERWGDRSGHPARSLAWALDQLDQPDEAFTTLERAMARRPDDGELMLYAADCQARRGNMTRAQEWLEQAKPHSQRSAWLRTAASLALSDNDRATAIEMWREVLRREPVAIDAHYAVTQLTAETEGHRAALASLREASNTFSHSAPLQQLFAEWMRDESRSDQEQALRQFVETHPENAWAHREYADVLGALGRWDEAFAALEVAAELEPMHLGLWNIRGDLLRRSHRTAEARTAYRRGIKLDVDNTYAIEQLLLGCDNRSQRLDALDFIWNEHRLQVYFGDGFLEYCRHAHEVLPAEELLSQIRELQKQRPDLWQLWSAAVHQLAEMGMSDQALATAQEATDRFPLIPRLFFDCARVHQLRGEADERIKVLEHSLALNPDLVPSLQELASAFAQRGDRENAVRILERAVRRRPLDASLHRSLAQCYRRMDREEESRATAERALELDPSDESIWSLMGEWTAKDEVARERLVQLAREQTQRRPGQLNSWLQLARVLDQPDQQTERESALAAARRLEPHRPEPYLIEADLWFADGNPEKALQRCTDPAPWNGEVPTELLTRAAEIEADQGELDAAIARLRGILERDPEDRGNWCRLADWCEANKDLHGALKAAEQLVAIAPHHPASYGYLGDAHKQLGNREAAADAFRRALELAPDYEFAAYSLADIHLQTNEFHAAEEVARSVREKSAAAPAVYDYLVRCAIGRNDRPQACQYLTELCYVQDERVSEVLLRVTTQFESCRWGRAAARTIEPLLSVPSVAPAAARRWVDLASRFESYSKLRKRIRDMDPRQPSGVVARLALMELVTINKWVRRGLHFWRVHKEALAADETLWCAAAEMLMSLNRYRTARRWLQQRNPDGEWSERSRLTLFMAHYSDGDEHAAREFLKGPVHSELALALWRAVDENLHQGNGAFVSHENPTELGPDERFLFELQRSLATAHNGSAREAPSLSDEAFAEIRRSIQLAVRAFPRFAARPELRRAFRKSIARIRKRRGTFGAWAWWLWSWQTVRHGSRL